MAALIGYKKVFKFIGETLFVASRFRQVIMLDIKIVTTRLEGSS
jgi:hypothetical protein